MAEIVATTSLPVDRLTATDCNAAARAKIVGSSYSFEAGFELLKVEKETSQSMNFPLYVLAMALATSQLTQYKTIRSGLFVV